VLKFSMTKYSAKWVLSAFLAAIPSGYWYLSVLPGDAHSLVEGVSPTIRMTMQYGLYAVTFLIAGTLILLLVKPSFHNKPAAFLVLTSAFLFLGAFEWTREAARRPFVINGVMYSNSIFKKDMEKIKREGFLQAARWVSTRDAGEDNLLEAGREIFKNQCYACHTIGGINNNIVVRTAFMDYPSLLNYIGKIHEIRYFMPPFAGNGAEKKALAYYIIRGIQGKSVTMAEERQEEGEDEGKELFTTHCTICHPESLVKARTAGWDRNRIRWALDNLNRLQSAMPDYKGTPAEKDLIAGYIFSLNAGDDSGHHDESKPGGER
jgi:mono/diheme cytochrome c family protein